jgi:two-component system sensor histidine kinase/response regulator
MAQNKKIDSLVISLEKEKSEINKIPTLRRLSNSLTPIDLEKKQKYVLQMRNIAEKYKIDSIIIVATLDLAVINGIKTNYDSSMYYFTKGLLLAKEKKLYSHEARAYVGIGYNYDRLDKSKEAIENYELALKIYKRINHPRGTNQTVINLGSLYFDVQEFKIADSYFRQALASFEKLEDQNGIAYGNFIVGNSSRALNKNAESYQYYKKSLEIHEKLGDLNGIALANFGLAEL